MRVPAPVAPAFDAPPSPVKDSVCRRLGGVPSGEEASTAFERLTRDDRAAVGEIRTATRPDLAAALAE